MLTDRQEVERALEVRALLLWLLPVNAFNNRHKGRVRRAAWRALGARIGLPHERLKRYWYGVHCPDGPLETLRAHAAELSRKVTEQSCITN